MSAEIRPSQLVTLKCKVDTGAGGNVMPLCAFAKLFPRHINADGSPRGLKSSTTCLTAYNGSKICQFGTLYTARLYSQRKRCCKLSTDPVVHSRHTGTSDPRTPIMCQTWHSGAQLCSQPPEEKVGAADETHNRRQESQTSSRNSETSTPQHQRTSSRLIKIDSKELAISQEPITSPYAVMPNLSCIHPRSAHCFAATGVRKLDEFLEQGIIIPVEEPTDWVGILTNSWKANGKLQICFGSLRCQQSHQKRPLQDSHC